MLDVDAKNKISQSLTEGEKIRREREREESERENEVWGEDEMKERQ